MRNKFGHTVVIIRAIYSPSPSVSFLSHWTLLIWKGLTEGNGCPLPSNNTYTSPSIAPTMPSVDAITRLHLRQPDSAISTFFPKIYRTEFAPALKPAFQLSAWDIPSSTHRAHPNRRSQRTPTPSHGRPLATACFVFPPWCAQFGSMNGSYRRRQCGRSSSAKSTTFLVR